MTLRELIASDYYRYNGHKLTTTKLIVELLFCKNHCFTYFCWWRIAKHGKLSKYLAKIMVKRLSRKYGIQIPYSTKIGKGFYIGHGVGIIINGSSIIGDNCNISQFTTIGSNFNKAAVIGNNVYMGPSVCLVEDITIGDNATIGAGAVVVKDVPANATVAGVPAKILHYEKPALFINNKA